MEKSHQQNESNRGKMRHWVTDFSLQQDLEARRIANQNRKLATVHKVENTHQSSKQSHVDDHFQQT